ncbi:hypothetical protein [Falsihalocynthiibacter arcticus]|uniref:Uncharacterized protein n=1 Tax=Falsihalocynthiibacter arcticus TaxID=1579316 RepID=A0A126V048_9RHOB|nr:hypothetical protein [Falsihalocynthiibacter arcticus]AML51708.1 hypothetical protein RC74_10940 [Falsihalocynthiibacter arcticus]
MKNPLIVCAFIVASPSPLYAEWDNTEWALNELKSVYKCGFCLVADEEYRDIYAIRLPKMEAIVTLELNEISEWMSSIPFRQADLPNNPGPAPYYVISPRGRDDRVQEILASRAASYHPSDGIELNFSNFISPLWDGGAYDRDIMIDNSTTLAHEIYHGVQSAMVPGEEEHPPTWFTESTPEAVGRAWAESKHGELFFNDKDYAQPLHNPDNIYNRDHFFYYLGDILQSEPTIAYLGDLDAKSGHDGHDGLLWLDTFLKGRDELKTGAAGVGLAEVYPRFIAAHAPDNTYFGSSDGEKQLSTSIAAGASSANDADVPPRHIEAVATTYAKMSGVFTGTWSGMDGQDRIYVNIVSIDQAERKDETRLIVGSILVPKGERYLTPVYAEAGEPKNPMHVRVTNVAETPYESTSQKVNLKLETAQIAIPLPTCMSQGREFELTIISPLAGAELQGLLGPGLSELRVSAGTLSADLSTYTAPDREQDVYFSITLPTIDGTTKEVLFKPVEVSDSCTPPLVGNMVASFNGDLRDFWHSFGLNSHGSTHWRAVLNIQTGTPKAHPFEMDVLIYPDDGSTFQLSGSSEFISCNRSDPATCNHSTKETYRGSGSIVVGRGNLEIVSDGENIWLEASLPVSTDMVNRGPFSYTQTIPTRWNIACVSADPWWHFAGDQHAIFIHGGRTAKLDGSWIDGSRKEIEFDCNETWGGDITDTGEYSASMHLQGLVRVKPQ